MKRLYLLIIILFSLTLFPCNVSYAEIDSRQVVAGTTIPETVLVERDGVKITAKKIYAKSEDSSNIFLTFNIQNARNEDLVIYSSDYSVNGFQLFA